MSEVITLRRFDTSQPWGFKMQGGADVGVPLFVASVSPNSISGQAGLKAGDAILKIGSTPINGFTHDQARGEMLRCGNDVELTVQRGVINAPPSQPSAPQADRARMSVSSVSDGDSPYQDVSSKTFKVLENELPQAEQTGARPASIFDKKRQNRSAYTKTDKSGYTKPFGQQ